MTLFLPEEKPYLPYAPPGRNGAVLASYPVAHTRGRALLHAGPLRTSFGTHRALAWANSARMRLRRINYRAKTRGRHRRSPHPPPTCREDIDHSRTKTKSPQNKWNRSVSSRRVDEQVVSCGVVIPDPDPERRASSRAIALLRNRKFVDSLLEGTGFELLVRGRGEAGCRAP